MSKQKKPTKTNEIDFAQVCEERLRDTDLRAELSLILPDEIMRQLDAVCKERGVSASFLVEAIVNAPGGAADRVGMGFGLPSETISWALSRARMLNLN